MIRKDVFRFVACRLHHFHVSGTMVSTRKRGGAPGARAATAEAGAGDAGISAAWRILGFGANVGSI